MIAVLFWSTVASAFKLTLNYFSFIELLFFSSFFSTVCFFLVLLLQKKIYLVFKSDRKILLEAAFLGCLNPFLYYLVLFKSYSILPAQIAQVLNYTWPIVLVILSAIFLKQKIKKMEYAAILISFLGAFVIISGGSLNTIVNFNSFGLILAFGSSLIWGFYWLLNLKSKVEVIVQLFLNFLFGLIYISVLYFSTISSVPDFRGIIGSAYVGCFEMGFTFILWLKAIRLSDKTSNVGNLIYLSPFLSLLLIRIFIKESIYLSTVIGLLLVVLGILLQRKFSSSKDIGED